MVGVNVPQRKQSGDGLGKLLTIGGAVAGGLLAGPGGAMAGAATGGGLGGMAGGLLAKAPQEGPQAVETGAISRRMAQLNESPLRQIRESIDSLKYIPDQAQRAELAMPLLKADYMARMKG